VSEWPSLMNTPKVTGYRSFAAPAFHTPSKHRLIRKHERLVSHLGHVLPKIDELTLGNAPVGGERTRAHSNPGNGCARWRSGRES
jgi:hypothetical protein